MSKMMWAVGLMSGTSLDGIDAALIKTDGYKVDAFGPWLTIPFEDEFRARVRECVYGRGDICKLENELTHKHATAVKEVLKKANLNSNQIEVVGFHGQTISHRPDEGITWQIGNGALLAELTRIDVVCDFRRRDVAAGGQGAPLVPLYHAALLHDHNLPVVILNIGGIGNVSWVGRSEPGGDILEHDIIAFDTGPGNVLINEWALKTIGKDKDEDGKLALAGKVDKAALDKLMSDPFFEVVPPKSLDRNYFDLSALEHLSKEDGAATITAFTAASIKAGAKYFPVPAKKWFVTGGGRHNPAMMQMLKQELGEVYSVDVLGWEGDAIEAQAFAFLAVRSLYNLPISLPTTTGANRAVTGGAFYRA